VPPTFRAARNSTAGRHAQAVAGRAGGDIPTPPPPTNFLLWPDGDHVLWPNGDKIIWSDD